MDAAEDEVDSEVGDDDAEERQHTVEVEGAGRGVNLQRRMHRQSIDDEGDERPDLLGVPRPIVAPRDVGPQRTDDDTEGEEEDSGIEQTLRQIEN